MILTRRMPSSSCSRPRFDRNDPILAELVTRDLTGATGSPRAGAAPLRCPAWTMLMSDAEGPLGACAAVLSSEIRVEVSALTVGPDEGSLAFVLWINSDVDDVGEKLPR
jgi:hypothetical protein